MMETLKNLNEMAFMATCCYNVYDGHDFELSDQFKESVQEINNCKISYNRFSAVIETKGTQNGVLNIYMPNQWFVVASFFTDLYLELIK